MATSDDKTPFEHLAVLDVNSAQEYIDPRLNLQSRPSAQALEEGIAQHSARTLRGEHPASQGRCEDENEGKQEKSDERSTPPSADILYIDWEKGDARNPANFSRGRKWAITIAASVFTCLSAAGASTYAMGYTSMTHDLNCTVFQATVGFSTYALGFAITPLVTAPFSEEFGRQPLYVASILIFLLMQLGIALAKNIQSVIIFRFICGAAGSTGSTMVGGTIADIWAPHERGVPMAVFSIAAISATGVGPVFSGWIEMNANLGWRWIQWVSVIIDGAFFIVMVITMKETRSSVLLTRSARRLREESGDLRYRARIEDERGSLRSLILLSCTRPIYLLFTEPVVASFSLWVGFAWGVLYVLVESISPAFQELHNFNIGEVGTVFVTMLIGSIFGYMSNQFYQERIYKKRVGVKGKEARLYSACFAGILFPASMFLYAWTSYANVHWIGMAIGITLFMWSMYIIYLTVFTYLADCYGPFASSALAGQSLCRNIAGTAFPLFTRQMYNSLTFKWASTIFAFIAVLMMPIPFVLFRWGPQIRARSKFAKAMPAFGS
ncbi:MFS general substrate transporter [Phellopilus nigrolimitatus]|nr:MFS general substrate transporter [Phellopilus nigrolimitatus]